VRDVLLATVDESTILPGVVLVSRQGLRVPAEAAGLDWRALQFLLDQSPEAGRCVRVALPRLATDSGGQTTVLVVHGSVWREGCANPPVARLQVVQGQLRVAASDQR
jgi:hypothetical protein